MGTTGPADARCARANGRTTTSMGRRIPSVANGCAGTPRDTAALHRRRPWRKIDVFSRAAFLVLDVRQRPMPFAGIDRRTAPSPCTILIIVFRADRRASSTRAATGNSAGSFPGSMPSVRSVSVNQRRVLQLFPGRLLIPAIYRRREWLAVVFGHGHESFAGRKGNLEPSDQLALDWHAWRRTVDGTSRSQVRLIVPARRLRNW